MAKRVEMKWVRCPVSPEVHDKVSAIAAQIPMRIPDTYTHLLTWLMWDMEPSAVLELMAAKITPNDLLTMVATGESNEMNKE